MRESFSIQPSGLCSWSNRTACKALPADTCKSAAADQSDVSSAHSACFLVNSVASTFLDACAKAFASSHCRKSANKSIAFCGSPAFAKALAAS